MSESLRLPMPCLARFLGALACLTLSAGAAVWSSPAWAGDVPSPLRSPRASSSAAEELAARFVYSDLVFIGEVESVVPRTGHSLWTTEARFRVDSVLVGVVLDSIEVAWVDRAPRGLSPGDQVLVQVLRAESDGRDVAIPIVIKDGVLLAHPDWPRMRLSDVLSHVSFTCDVRVVLGQSIGLAVVELLVPSVPPGSKHPMPGGFWPCAKSRWLVPSGGPLPRLVRFGAEPRWPDEAAAYLVAIPQGNAGDTVSVGCTPARLEIRQGIVSALGVPVARVRDFVRRSAAGRLQLVVPPLNGR